MTLSPLNIAEIFWQASQLSDADAQSAFLDRVCKDAPKLRRDVERLLSARTKAESFLEQCPFFDSSDIDGSPITERPGSIIGNYELIEKIGEGGFGIVFLAEQHRPIRRRTALKIIKPGKDTKQVIARFDLERQALAVMNHPNIARVFDAGATDSGRPYFVMELVKGVPITKYCDECQLSVQERLRLFVSVCQAVQHAHFKGIIHRDIKPTNVLVAIQDGKPLVKVIDFGIAKATDSQLGEHSQLTGFHEMIGTPQYMSPEQAEMAELDVDTRTDVYSLGVLLYELLTSTTPMQGERLKTAGYDEIRRIIREEDAPHLSKRLGSLTQDQLASVSQRRRLDPKRLRRTLRGELDWLVLRALEKDRNRRYESVRDLVADVQRYLNNEPVEACPPSRWYRFKKFARRNRTALTAATLVVVVLLIATTVSTWLAIDAIVARNLANKRLIETKRQRAIAKASATKADKAAVAAKQAMVRAQNSANTAKRNEEHSRQLVYCADMKLAHRAWQDEDPRSLADLLNKHRPNKGDVDRRGFEWWYLSDRARLENTAIRPGIGACYCVRYSPDGKWIYIGTDVGIIHVYDAKTRKRKRTFLGHLSYLMDMAISRDGKTMASIDATGGARLWTLPNGKSTLSFQAHNDNSSHRIAFALGDTRLITCGDSRDVMMWNASNGKLVHKFSGHSDRVEAIACSPDGTILAAIDRHRRCSIWDVKSKDKIHSFETPIATQMSLEFSPDGTQLATCGRDRLVHLWDVKTGRSLAVFTGHQDFVTDVSFSKDGAILVSSDSGGVMRFWRVDAERQFRSKSNIGWCGFAPNGQLYVTTEDGIFVHDLKTDKRTPLPFVSSDDLALDVTHPCEFSSDGKRLKIFSKIYEAAEQPNQWRLLATLKRDARELGPAAFTPDGNRVATVDRKGQVRLWNADTGEKIAEINASDETNVQDLKISPDGKLLACVGHHKGTVLWDLVANKRRAKLPYDDGTIRGAFSADSRWLATSSWDWSVRIWDTSSGKLNAILEHSGPVHDVAFSPDGERLIVVGKVDENRHIFVWRVKERKLLRSFPANCYIAGLSPDGRWLATGRQFGYQVWNLSAPHGRRRLPPAVEGHQNRIWRVQFGPHRHMLASAGRGGQVRLWNTYPPRRTEELPEPITDVQVSRANQQELVVLSEESLDVRDVKTLKHIRRLGQFKDPGNCVDQSPDGRFLITGHEEGQVRIWSFGEGKLLHKFKAHDGHLLDLELSRDGKTLATGGWDTTVKTWDLATRKLLRVGRKLSHCRALSFLSDGDRLVASAGDNAYIERVKDGKLLNILGNHNNTLQCIAVSPDGALIATGSHDRTIRIWDSATGKELRVIRAHKREIEKLAFSPDGKTLASGDRGGVVVLSHVEQAQPLVTIHVGDDEVRRLFFFPNGEKLAVSINGMGVVLLHAPKANDAN